ncbi:MAG: ATP-binding cassette domain-containing protein [Pseudomonadota bacterium]
MADDPQIYLKNIYKIFGPRPKRAMERLRQGMDKQTLLDRYNNLLGLADINLEIPRHQVQVIMGLSGSGKSTLIRHINRLMKPTSGQVFIDDTDILTLNDRELRELRCHRVSMVFQRFALFPHRTVMDNVCYGLEIQKRPNAQSHAQQWIDRVGLTGYEDFYPPTLSGGMQQRVGLARALATDADILLMDEPFSALDPLIRREMQDLVVDLQNELHKTVVFITHDLDEALRLGDQVALLQDGSIVQKGVGADFILRPANEYVASFTKDINAGKYLSCGAIMESLPPQYTHLDTLIPSGTPIEKALHTLCQTQKNEALITNGKDEPVGLLTLGKISQAIDPDHGKSPHDRQDDKNISSAS